MRRREHLRAARAVVVVALLAGAAGCGPEPDPIIVDRDRISIFNRTDAAWHQVEIRLNRYYVASVGQIPAGGRVDAPLARFQGGFGRYFDAARERVRSVEVTGSSADGTPVALAWRDGAVESRSGT